MKHKDALLVIGIVMFIASTSLVLFFSQSDATGQLYGGSVDYKSIAKAPYTDLPYNGKPIEMPFAGRCYRDEGDQVVYHQVATQDVGRVFDGCYDAADGEKYYYDYYCVGNARISQVWLRISPDCK